MTTQKIQILYDPQCLEDTDEQTQSLTVMNISGYVKTYKFISNSLAAGQSAKILVRDKTVFTWLSKLRDNYPEQIGAEEVTPRRLLEEKWAFTVPDEVSNEEVIELNLLTLPKEENIKTFSDFILQKFVSPAAVSTNIPMERISSLVSALESENIKNNLNKQLVKREFMSKVENWIENAKTEPERELADLLIEDTDGLQTALSQYAILANYPPEVGQRAIGKLFTVFKVFKINTSAIQIKNDGKQTAINNIEIFLNSEFQSLNSSDALTIILWSSGLVYEEFATIKNLLKKFPQAINKEVIDELEQKFSSHTQKIAPELRKLSLMVKPQLPNDPAAEWDASKMLEWATNQYLPYHFWLEETNQVDPKISNQCETFGDWLYSNFVDLRSGFQNIAYKILPKYITPDKSDKCLLIVVIDNFNFKFADLITDLIANAGFSLIRKQPYFSMLPSETETSKRLLFAGQPKLTDVNPNKDYRSLILDEWQKSFPNKRFLYLQSTLDLEEAEASRGDVVLVNCNQIDSALHEDERKLGKKHTQQIEAELQSIVALITQFCNRNDLVQNISIMICSDHGSTMIPYESANEIDPSFFVGKTIDTHHRFVSISQEEYQKLPQTVKEYQTYLLDSGLFGLPQSILVAKGYYRFKKTNDHFYVHGGLSPEETILPLLIFESGKAELKMPLIRLLNNEFRFGTKSLAEFEVVNENSAPIEDVTLTITQLAGAVEVIEPAPVMQKIESMNFSRIKIALRFYRKIESDKNVEVTLDFKLQGRKHTIKQKLPVQMKSLMETSFKL